MRQKFRKTSSDTSAMAWYVFANTNIYRVRFRLTSGSGVGRVLTHLTARYVLR